MGRNAIPLYLLACSHRPTSYGEVIQLMMATHIIKKASINAICVHGGSTSSTLRILYLYRTAGIEV